MASGASGGGRASGIRKMFCEVPPASSYEPNTAALARAQELGDAEVIAALVRFQEALGIYGASRTYLTYVYRGFGWMMDAREQLQQKIMRPVIAPDPSVIPTDRSDPTIPDVVLKMHRRLAERNEAFSPGDRR